MQNFDICGKFGVDAQIFAATLSDNTAYTIPVGLVNVNKRAISVSIIDASLPTSIPNVGNLLVSYAITYDSGNAPIITPQFIGDVGTIYCQLLVLFKR